MIGGLFLLLLGAVLILAGSVAGRAQARAIGLARWGRAPRIAAVSAGLLCVVVAVILIGSDDSGSPAGPVSVTITDELGPGQAGEEVTVFVDGRRLGVLRIDDQSPRASLTATIARAGRHDYRTVAESEVEGQKRRATNSGEVVIGDGHRLEVRTDDQGRTYLKPE